MPHGRRRVSGANETERIWRVPNVFRCLRRKPHRLLCPFCGCRFFWVRASLARHKNRLPFVTGMEEGLECADCGLVTDYHDFVKQHRGWL